VVLSYPVFFYISILFLCLFLRLHFESSFFVLSFSSFITINNNIMTTRGRVLAGGRDVSLAEVCHVALDSFEVLVEEKNLEKMEANYIKVCDERKRGKTKGKGRGKGKKGAAAIAPVSTPDASDPAADTSVTNTTSATGNATPDDVEPCEPQQLCENDIARVSSARAIVMVRLVMLLHARVGIRSLVAQRLSDMLNNGVTPRFPAAAESDSDVLQYLVRVLAGQGECVVQQDQPLPYKVMRAMEAFNSFGWDSILLSNEEHQSFVQCTAATTAIAALTVYGGRTLLDLADHTAALTCEAIQATLAPFREANSDDVRAHKGQVDTAANLRLLLEGSLVVNRSSRLQCDPPSIRCIPQYHGPARSSYAAIARAIRVELNSTERLPFGNTTDHIGPFDPQPVLSATLNLMVGLATVSSGSNLRAGDIVMLASDIKDANNTTDVDSGIQGLLLASTAKVQQLRHDVSRLTSVCAATVHSSSNDKRAVDDQKHSSSGSDVAAADTTMGPVSIARKMLENIDSVATVLRIEALAALQTLSLRDKSAYALSEIALEKRKAAMLRKQEAEAKKAAEAAAAGKPLKPKKAKKNKNNRGNDASNMVAKGLILGARIAEFRSVITSQPRQPAETDGELKQNLDSLTAILNPFSATLGELLRRLLTRSNTGSKADVPKGTRDLHPPDMIVRQRAFETITNVFRRHGAVSIDTPVFELKDTLTNKYGEDSKLIYDLADQGGQMLALRYDLTVPFARYCGSHGVTNIKRYHIARVYRRDQPNMNKGRYREFYQCDFDIAGVYPSMMPDSEALKVLTEILDSLDIGAYQVKINHRKLLDGMMDLCGVPAEKFRPICSAIDKLDKLPWEKVREEMVQDKGLDPAAADRIAQFVGIHGNPMEVSKRLRAEQKELAEHPQCAEALNEMDKLFAYLEALGCVDRFSFDMSLARGLDYYTGVIYEAIMVDTTVPQADEKSSGASREVISVGSIAAGGRYDNLIGMFGSKQVPAVGVSIGIERVFTIMKKRMESRGKVRSTMTQVLVASIGKEMVIPRMQLCNELWRNSIRAEFIHHENPKPDKQLAYALENGIPIVIWLGSDEVERAVANVKILATEIQSEVARSELVEFLHKNLAEVSDSMIVQEHRNDA
jgi:histidyl-tRNA synthetase